MSAPTPLDGNTPMTARRRAPMPRRGSLISGSRPVCCEAPRRKSTLGNSARPPRPSVCLLHDALPINRRWPRNNGLERTTNKEIIMASRSHKRIVSRMLAGAGIAIIGAAGPLTATAVDRPAMLTAGSQSGQQGSSAMGGAASGQGSGQSGTSGTSPGSSGSGMAGGSGSTGSGSMGGGSSSGGGSGSMGGGSGSGGSGSGGGMAGGGTGSGGGMGGGR